ncbi:hypothetical protein D3C80_1368550 [compost metagenome]
MNFTFSSSLLKTSEFLELMVVESNCPNKSPDKVFKSGVISLASKVPERLIFEFSFPLIALAIGAIFVNMSNCVNVWLISTEANPKSMLNVGFAVFVETFPLAVINPLKIEVFMFCKVTASSFTMIFPETSFKFKLS